MVKDSDMGKVNTKKRSWESDKEDKPHNMSLNLQKRVKSIKAEPEPDYLRMKADCFRGCCSKRDLGEETDKKRRDLAKLRTHGELELEKNHLGQVKTEITILSADELDSRLEVTLFNDQGFDTRVKDLKETRRQVEELANEARNVHKEMKETMHDLEKLIEETIHHLYFCYSFYPEINF